MWRVHSCSHRPANAVLHTQKHSLGAETLTWLLEACCGQATEGIQQQSLQLPAIVFFRPRHKIEVSIQISTCCVCRALDVCLQKNDTMCSRSALHSLRALAAKCSDAHAGRRLNNDDARSEL